MEPEQSIAQSAEELDRQLARLFYRRMELAALKAREQGEACPVFESEQEPALPAELAGQDPALERYYRAFRQTGRQLAAQYQLEVLGRDRVAYQGVEGAFSHIALRKLFPLAKAKSYPTWAAVFDAVESGEAAYGVLPFENSNAGDVSAVLDPALPTQSCTSAGFMICRCARICWRCPGQGWRTFAGWSATPRPLPRAPGS